MKRSMRRHLLKAVLRDPCAGRYHATARVRLPGHVRLSEPPVWAPEGYVTLITGWAWARRVPGGRLHLVLAYGGPLGGRDAPYEVLSGVLEPYGLDGWGTWFVGDKHHRLRGAAVPGTYEEAELPVDHPAARWLEWNRRLGEEFNARLDGGAARPQALGVPEQPDLASRLPVFLVDVMPWDNEWFWHDVNHAAAALDRVRASYGPGCKVTFAACTGRWWLNTPLVAWGAWPGVKAMPEGGAAGDLRSVMGL